MNELILMRLDVARLQNALDGLNLDDVDLEVAAPQLTELSAKLLEVWTLLDTLTSGKTAHAPGIQGVIEWLKPKDN
jgi:hypothetical protein